MADTIKKTKENEVTVEKITEHIGKEFYNQDRIDRERARFRAHLDKLDLVQAEMDRNL